MLLRSSERATFSASTTCDSSVRASRFFGSALHTAVRSAFASSSAPSRKLATPRRKRAFTRSGSISSADAALARASAHRSSRRCVAARLVCSESSVGAAAASDVCFVR